MKKALFFGLLSFCLLITPVVGLGANNSNGWENRPLMKRSAGKQAPTKNNEDAPKKSRLKKNAIAWYKKPAAQYAAGGLFSAAVGAYALFRYMQGEVAIPVTEDKVAVELATDNQSDSNSVNSENNGDNTLPADNKIVLTNESQEKLSEKEKAKANRKNAADNIAKTVVWGTGITVVGLGLGELCRQAGVIQLISGFFS